MRPGPAARFDADTNGDGVKNGMAFLLGAASPTSAVTQPTVTEKRRRAEHDLQLPADRRTWYATLKVDTANDLVHGPRASRGTGCDDAVPDNNVTFVVGRRSGRTSGAQ